MHCPQCQSRLRLKSTTPDTRRTLVTRRYACRNCRTQVESEELPKLVKPARELGPHHLDFQASEIPPVLGPPVYKGY